MKMVLWGVIVVLILILVYRIAFRARPTVALVSTHKMGSIDQVPVDVLVGRHATASHLVPLVEGKDIVFVETAEKCFSSTIRRLYRQGVRLFVGAFTTQELLSVNEFMKTHPRAVMLSTASTSPTLEKADNIFRFIPSDTYAVPLFVDAILKQTPEIVIVVEDVGDYPHMLRRLFQTHARDAVLKTFTHRQMSDALRYVRARPDVGLVMLIESPEATIDALPTDLTNRVFVSDILAFYPLDPARQAKANRLRINAFVSWIMHEDCNAFSRVMVGRNVSPFVFNILIALWYISDMYHSGEHTLSRAHVTCQRLFRPNGDSALNHVALVAPKGDEWEVVGGVMSNPFMRKFHY
jgi:hypothetical protein